DQIGNDHCHVDGDHGDRHAPSGALAVGMTDELDQASIAVMPDTGRDAEYCPQDWNRNQDHPAYGVAEGSARYRGRHDGGRVKISRTGDNAGRQFPKTTEKTG